MTGYVEQPTDFGSGSLPYGGGYGDVFVVVYDINDALVFAREYGNDGYEQGYGIDIDANGGVVVVGRFFGTLSFGTATLTAGDSFILRLDASGNHLWSKQIVPGVMSRTYAVAFDTSGAVHVTGEVEDHVDFGGGDMPGNGARDVFVVKYDAQGNHLWSQRFGDSDIQSGLAIDVDASGNVYVVGTFYGSINFGGQTITNPFGVIGGFLVKFDANGNHLWTKQLGGVTDLFALSASCDASGNVVVTGQQEGTFDYGGGPLTASGKDVFVAAYSPSGAHLWSNVYGDGALQVGKGVSVDASGNVVVAGNFFGTVNFGGQPLVSSGDSDVFMTKFSPSGSHLWSKAFGDAAAQEVSAVTTDTAGRVGLAGKFSGTINFGGNTFMADPVIYFIDGFLARFEP